MRNQFYTNRLRSRYDELITGERREGEFGVYIGSDFYLKG